MAKKILKITFWIAVGIGVIWFLNREVVLFDNNKEDKIYKQLQKVCGAILQQQPSNISLYDDCMNRGSEEFQ